MESAIRATLVDILSEGNGNDTSSWIDDLARISPDLIKFYGLSPRGYALLVGQIMAETGGFNMKVAVEDHRYRWQTVVKTFSYRIGLARDRYGEFRSTQSRDDIAKILVAGDGEYLFNVVYGWRMGNGPADTGDGHRYRGRGLSQITGRSNYRAITQRIREQPGCAHCPDLESTPDAILEAEWCVRSAFADWAEKGLSRYVLGQADDYKKISAALNAGNAKSWNVVNGKERRERWSKICVRFIQDIAPEIEALAQDAPLRMGSTGKRVRHLQEMLIEAGYPLGAADGHFGRMTRDALRNFQDDNGLPLGPCDSQCLSVLERSEAVDLDRSEETTRHIPDDTVKKAVKANWWQRLLGLSAGSYSIWEISSQLGQIPDMGVVVRKLSVFKPLADWAAANPLITSSVVFGVVLLIVVQSWRSGNQAASQTVQAYKKGALRS